MSVFEAERRGVSIVYKSQRRVPIEILSEPLEPTEVSDKVSYIAGKYGSSSLERVIVRGGTWTFHSQEEFENADYTGLYLIPNLEERIRFPEAVDIYAIEENGRVTETSSKTSDWEDIERALDGAQMSKFGRGYLQPFGLEAIVKLEPTGARSSSPVLTYTRFVPSNPRSFVDHEFPYFPRIGKI